MMTFNKAETLYKSARNKVKGKPIGNNLRIVQYGLSYAIQYHETLILIIRSDGEYQYNNGGWYTVSTKKHLNTYGPLRIFQKNHAWFYTSHKTGVTVPYVNGIITHL